MDGVGVFGRRRVNLAFVAQSGWGKGYHAQSWMEASVGDYEALVVLDFCREYRGLVKAGLADHWIIGPVELQATIEQWAAILRENPRIVLERRTDVPVDQWREVCAKIAAAVRRLDRDQLVAVDEAHFVTPQQGKLPDSLKYLATTGRGAGTSSMWITQRTAEIDKTILTQCQARMVGGFKGGDLGNLSGEIEYPEIVHNPSSDPDPARLPDGLLPEDRERPASLQKHKDGDGNTIGSEWIYSDDDGEIRRVDTQNVTMQSTHYGSQGNDLTMPDYS